MVRKKVKPRRSDGKISFDLFVRDGNTPIFSTEGRLFKDLDEVLELLDKKL